MVTDSVKRIPRASWRGKARPLLPALDRHNPLMHALPAIGGVINNVSGLGKKCCVPDVFGHVSGSLRVEWADTQSIGEEAIARRGIIVSLTMA
jgi:hypothetical protein